MNDITRDINPYAPPQSAEPPLALAIPRRWLWWSLCDSLWFTGFIGFAMAGLGATFVALVVELQLDPGVFPAPEILQAAVAAGGVLVQALLAGTIFGFLVGLNPRLPLFSLRIFLLLLPLVTHPLTVVLLISPGGFGWGAHFASLVLGWMGTSYALHLVAQNVSLFLAAVGRWQTSVPPAAQATQVEAGWMRRVLLVSLPGERYRVEYDGRKLGLEVVNVDGRLAASGRSFMQLAPHFEFPLGSHRGELHVTGWPWLQLRSVVLAVDGVIVFRQGF